MPEKSLRLTKIYITIALVYIVGEVVISILPVRPYRTGIETLSEYQAARAAGLRGGELILLGDSSLGNAVDEDLLSELTGQRCRNLALVAFFGPRGDEILLEEILSKPERQHPRAVVLMHNPNNWNHRGNDGAVSHLIETVAPPPLDLLADKTFGRLPSVQRSRSYKSIFFTYNTGLQYNTSTYAKSIAEEESASREITEIGFIPQKGKIEVDPENPGDLGSFLPYYDSEKNLRELFSLAGRHGVTVFVATGPLWRGRVKTSGKFLADLESWLGGIAADYENVSFLYKGAPAVPDALVGDTLEHISPEGATQFTRWLGPVVRARLAGDQSTAPPINWAAPAGT
jgi:hypothetical protein